MTGGFMTRLAISLLAGFAVAAFVWTLWSIIERFLARKPATSSAATEKGRAEEKDESVKGKSDAKARAK